MQKNEFIDTVQNKFQNKRVLVLGDLMVDEYITGKVSRISPEAPVPVLNFKEKRLEAGGASNVARNLKILGAQVLVVGTVGNDEGGSWIKLHLQNEKMEVEGIFTEEGSPTTIKTRFATKGQQLLRMDNEDSRGTSEAIQAEMLKYIKNNIEKVDAIVLSDYKKGVLESGVFVQNVIKLCNQYHVLITIDSKRRNIEAFENADFVKPNNLELEEAVGIKIMDDESLNLAGKKYLRKSGAKSLIVTRGAMGISVFMPGHGRKDFPAEEAQVYDVTGAGDTVISTITLAMIGGMDIYEAVQLANLAASVVISKEGTVAVTRQELIEKINER